MEGNVCIKFRIYFCYSKYHKLNQTFPVMSTSLTVELMKFVLLQTYIAQFQNNYNKHLRNNNFGRYQISSVHRNMKSIT